MAAKQNVFGAAPGRAHGVSTSGRKRAISQPLDPQSFLKKRKLGNIDNFHDVRELGAPTALPERKQKDGDPKAIRKAAATRRPEAVYVAPKYVRFEPPSTNLLAAEDRIVNAISNAPSARSGWQTRSDRTNWLGRAPNEAEMRASMSKDEMARRQREKDSKLRKRHLAEAKLREEEEIRRAAAEKLREEHEERSKDWDDHLC